MINPVRTTAEIAGEAIDSLRGCRELFQQLESTMIAAKQISPERSNVARVVAMAAFVAMDQANSIDCVIEDLQGQLEAATQNAF